MRTIYRFENKNKNKVHQFRGKNSVVWVEHFWISAIQQGISLQECPSIKKFVASLLLSSEYLSRKPYLYAVLRGLVGFQGRTDNTASRQDDMPTYNG